MSDRVAEQEKAAARALYHLVVWFSTGSAFRSPDVKMMLELGREILPHINRNDAELWPLLDALQVFLDLSAQKAGDRRCSDWSFAYHKASKALDRHCKLHIGLALDLMRGD